MQFLKSKAPRSTYSTSYADMLLELDVLQEEVGPTPESSCGSVSVTVRICRTAGRVGAACSSGSVRLGADRPRTTADPGAVAPLKRPGNDSP